MPDEHHIRIGHRTSPVFALHGYGLADEWRASCRCGWKSAWTKIGITTAEKRGTEHLKEATNDRHRNGRVEADR